MRIFTRDITLYSFIQRYIQGIFKCYIFGYLSCIFFKSFICVYLPGMNRVGEGANGIYYGSDIFYMKQIQLGNSSTSGIIFTKSIRHTGINAVPRCCFSDISFFSPSFGLLQVGIFSQICVQILFKLLTDILICVDVAVSFAYNDCDYLLFHGKVLNIQL